MAIVATWGVTVALIACSGVLTIRLWLVVGASLIFGYAVLTPIPAQRVPLRPGFHPLWIFGLPILSLSVALLLVVLRHPATEWSWMLVGGSLIVGGRLKDLIRKGWSI